MSSNISKFGTLAGLVVLLVSSTSWAQSSGRMPGLAADPRIEKLHEQAEEVFGRGDYERAYFIYRNDLAPIGDKYGQYMVGYLHLTGKGVEQDAIAASAWYRLAAERGSPDFVRARDTLMKALKKEEYRAESDRQFIELRQQYGDLMLMTRLIRADFEELHTYGRFRTGLGGSSIAPLDLGNTNTQGYGSKKEHYERLERQVKSRLDFVSEQTGIDIDNWRSLDMDVFEKQVADSLAELP